ncbi:MAG: hypothetical protein MUF34_26290, partial [Polyangiaceae bacterium]|nr:hypothetical protein [Polyangiaceae bacterium]
RPNAEYRLLWADRVQRHLFAGGALAGESVQQRLRARAEEIRQAIIAESARWGDAQRPREPFGKPDWENAAAFSPGRNDLPKALPPRRTFTRPL